MTIALFVVGRSGSGKTTLTKMLEHLGVFRISASTHLSRLYSAEFGKPPTRLQLADYGKSLRQQGRLEPFHCALIGEMANREIICVDGLRFKVSVDEVSKYAKRWALVFLSCPKELRDSRLSATVQNDELPTLNLHETETSVDAMNDEADFRIDTSEPVEVAFAQLQSILDELRTR